MLPANWQWINHHSKTLLWQLPCAFNGGYYGFKWPTFWPTCWYDLLYTWQDLGQHFSQNCGQHVGTICYVYDNILANIFIKNSQHNKNSNDYKDWKCCPKCCPKCCRCRKSKQLAKLANNVAQSWPTFINMLINVGAIFWGIFPFTNMLVAAANRANILGNKCWRAMLAEMLARFAPPLRSEIPPKLTWDYIP